MGFLAAIAIIVESLEPGAPTCTRFKGGQNSGSWKRRFAPLPIGGQENTTGHVFFKLPLVSAYMFILSGKISLRQSNIVTLWLFNIAMENGPFIDDFPIETSIYKGFSIAMLNNQMVVEFSSYTTPFF